MIEVRKVQLDKSRRMIVISDIHANLPLFERLLEHIGYSKEDYLFINGDICEKGPDSLTTAAYVRELVQSSDRVFMTKGNCDVLHQEVFKGSEWITRYMQQRERSILNEMLIKQGKRLEDYSDLQQLGEFYQVHYGELLDWLNELPVAYETDDYIIVHAGLDNILDWSQTSEKSALSIDAFYEKGHQADKIVIVGHWPVVNYRAQSISSHNILIDEGKRIIALDGGNQIKEDGQLNALIINGGTYNCTFVQELKRQAVIQKEHTDDTGRVGTVTYPNYNLRVVKREKYFTLCDNVHLGIQQWIKNEYLADEQEETICKDDLSTTFLSVDKEERVFIVDDACDGYTLIKRENGACGWIPKECLG